MQPPIFHVYCMIGIHIRFDQKTLTKVLQHMPWNNLLSIGVEVFPLIQISSNNLKRIIICWFIHGVVCHTNWVPNKVILKIPEDTIYIINLYLYLVTQVFR